MKKRIVVIGGGFAGVNLCKKLNRIQQVEVVLVDQNNYNFFTPLIYQVATGFLEPSSISYPFRALFSGKANFRFHLGALQKIVPQENKLILSNGEMTYDYLVLATGSVTNFFGNEDIQKYAIPMNTMADALNMRNILLQRLEKASRLCDRSDRKNWATMVIAGGGPTGVEISGMFAEMRNHIITKEYPELQGTPARIYLVTGGKTLLPPMGKKSQAYAYEKLKAAGVEIILNTRVIDFDGAQIKLDNDTSIESKNLIWATGVTALKFEGISEARYGKGNRVKVDAFNKLEGYENIYAIGDTCLQTTDQNFPNGHPQLAQVAMQQGKNLAENFRNREEGKKWMPFCYNDKGSMAIIGRSKAVADFPKPKWHLQGFFAWLIWSGVHLFSLVGHLDQIRTFYNWSVAYLTKNQDLRMIIRPGQEVD